MEIIDDEKVLRMAIHRPPPTEPYDFVSCPQNYLKSTLGDAVKVDTWESSRMKVAISDSIRHVRKQD